MIVEAIFLLIMNHMLFHFAYEQKENYYYDHISFNFKGIRYIFFRVHDERFSLGYYYAGDKPTVYKIFSVAM